MMIDVGVCKRATVLASTHSLFGMLLSGEIVSFARGIWHPRLSMTIVDQERETPAWEMAEVAELEWTVVHISDEADRLRHSIAPSLGYVRTDAFDQVERLIARLLRE